MNTLVKCPKCSAEIEDDSFYCDQCGIELYICPQCRTFGKGKFCSKCRSALVPASKNGNKNAEKSTEHIDEKRPENPVSGGTVKTVLPTRLVCKEAGITLALKHGAIIGRRNGDYVSLLQNQQYVSGTHARLDCAMTQWSITDLGSTNGTCINNGAKLSPNVAAKFNVGDKIRIATLDFIVE